MIIERPVTYDDIDYKILIDFEENALSGRGWYGFTEANIYFDEPADVDVSKLKLGDDLFFFPSFQAYIDGVIRIRSLSRAISKYLFEFPIITTDINGMFIQNNDAALLFSLQMPKE